MSGLNEEHAIEGEREKDSQPEHGNFLAVPDEKQREHREAE